MSYDEYIIKDYENWSLFLHNRQSYLGRVYLWARRENALDFMEMTPEEQTEFFQIGRNVKKALAELFQPDLLNYASLGNEARHLHVHFIPRYKSPRTFGDVQFVDERWGKNYAPYDQNFEVPKKVILEIRDAIKARL